MKKTVLIFVLAVVFICAQTEETAETETEPKNENSSEEEESSEYLDFIHSFRKSFYNSYEIRKSCENHTEELEAADRVLEKCINRLGNNHTLCESVEGYLLNCTSPAIEVLNECLPPQSKYLPNLGVKAVVSGVDYWCNQRGEAIFEIFNPCIWRSVFGSRSKELQDCHKKFRDVTKEYEEEYPSPNRLCRDFGDLRNCVKLWVTSSCKSVKTQNAVVGFYDAVLQPCKKYNV